MSGLPHRLALAIRPPALALVMALASAPLSAATFNYHGQLMDGDAPASGRYDLRMRTFAHADAKAALGASVDMPGVDVIDGSFAVELDLPESKIGDTYVEVAVRKADSNDAFEVLGAPQKIAKANNGCWALDGNTGMAAGSFLGVADPVSTLPLVLRARNAVIGTLTPRLNAAQWGDAPSVAFGSSANTATAEGATVAGGGGTRDSAGNVCASCRNLASGDYATITGGVSNTSSALGSTIGGGAQNVAAGILSVSTGYKNIANAEVSTISGGQENQADGLGSTIGGGQDNQAGGQWASIGGGYGMMAPGDYSIAPGGVLSCAGGDGSFAAGSNAKVRHGNELDDLTCFAASTSGDADGDEGTFVWSDRTPNTFTSTGPNQFLLRADGGMGLNTATMGAATNLRFGEIVVKNSSGDPNTDITLLNATNRGYGLVAEPGAVGVAGRFYITEINATAAGVLFDPKLRINTDGTTSVVGGAVTNISDARVKKNIAEIDAPLDTLLALRGHTFEYIDPAASMNPPGTRIGFIAQEVREVLPQWIADVGDGYLGVQTSGFEALTVEAIRDLKTASDARIESLESDNVSLRAQLDEVLTRLAQLESRSAN